MEVYRRSSGLLLLLGFALLATTLQGVQGEVESEGPSESECRPYIEKALKELEAGEGVVGSSETVDSSKEDTSTVEIADDSEPQDGDGDDNDTNEDGQDSKENKGSIQETVSEIKSEPEVRQTVIQMLSNRISQFFQRTPVIITKEATVEEKSSEDKETDASGEQDQASEEGGNKSDEADENKDESKEEESAAADQDSVEAQADEADEDSKADDDEHKESAEQTESAEETEADSKGDAADSQEEAAEEDVEEETDVDGDKETEEDQTESKEEQVESKEEQTESKEEQAESKEDQPESKEDETAEGTAESVEEEAGTESIEEQEAQPQSVEEEQVESTEQEESKEVVEEEQDQADEKEEPAESKEESVESAEQAETDDQDTTQEDDGDSKEAAAGKSQEEQPEASEEKQESVEEDDVKEGESKQEVESAEGKQESAEDEGKQESAEEDQGESQEKIDSESNKEDKESEEEKTVEKREAGDEPGDENKEKVDESEEDKKTGDEDIESSEPTEDDSNSGEGDAGPVEELSLDVEMPTELRPREHVEHLLKLDEESSETEQVINRVNEITLRELKKLYENAIKPLEVLYKYRDLSNRHFGDAEIFSKPLILFMGPWSGGKSSIINYLVDIEYNETALRTGAEPSPAYFNILMYGEEPEIIDGTELAADFTFSGLQKFGQGLEERLRGVKVPSKLLEKVNVVEIPGILEVRKQVSRVFPFNDACQWFIDRADIIFLVYDPSKLDVGPETEAILDQLKGREQQTRIILNKADQVKPEELMRVQGALIWNISPLMSSPQPPVMYTTSLWSRPYESWAPTKLLQAQERAFLRDFRGAIDKRIENKIASARRFAVRVRNHAKMVDCYLTTYYNHKSVFGNRKQVADEIIDHPQDYHIYEGLSTLTNISRYDLPDPDVYRDFFKLNPLYEFQQLSATCTYFRGCPINRLDIAIAYDLPELVGTHRKLVEKALEESANQSSAPGS